MRYLLISPKIINLILSLVELITASEWQSCQHSPGKACLAWSEICFKVKQCFSSNNHVWGAGVKQSFCYSVLWNSEQLIQRLFQWLWCQWFQCSSSFGVVGFGVVGVFGVHNRKPAWRWLSSDRLPACANHKPFSHLLFANVYIGCGCTENR